MATKNQVIGGGFQDPLGVSLANGFLLLTLSQDAQVNGSTQIAAGFTIKINLDGSGNITTSPAQSVWPNDVLSPNGTFYLVSAYSAVGQLVWGPNAQQVLSTPSPFNIGAWVPAAVNVGIGGGGTAGTVTSFSFTNANGVLGSVANPSTTPNLTLSLGNITPLSVTSIGTIEVASSVPADSGSNKSSPPVTFQGNYWNGSASAADDWAINTTFGVGANPTSFLTFAHSGSSGGGQVLFDAPVQVAGGSLLFAFGGLLVQSELFCESDLQVSSYLGTGSGTFIPNFPSPSLELTGGYYNGTNVQPDTWFLQNVIGTGVTPTSILTLLHTGSSGAAQFQVPNLNSAGNVEAGSLVVSGGSQFDGGWSSLGISVLTAENATSSSGNVPAPEFRHANQYWDGSASQSDQWNWICTIGTGTTPTTQLTLQHAGSPGDAEFHVPNLNLDSVTTAATATAGSATLPTNPLGFWDTTINGTAVKIPYYAT